MEYINTIYKGDKDLDGVTLHMYRVPIEILDKDKKVVTKLNVAKMAETGVLVGTGSTATLNIDKDSDRFYIRVKGVGTGQGKCTIKVATMENPDGDTYNGKETVIDMKVDGGFDRISESMLLVSDKVDDEHDVPVGVKDRTHKIQLGGKLQVKSVTFGGKEYPIDNRTTVPVQKTVDVNIVIVRPIDGDENAFIEKVKTYWKVVNERYAQVGVKVNIQGPEVKDAPTGVDLEDGSLTFSEDGNDGKPLADEARKLITGLGTKGDSSDIHVFYVKKIKVGNTDTIGIAITDLYYKSTEPDYTYNAFIQAKLDDTWSGYVAAHELGHLLANEDHKGPSQNYPSWHLMYGGVLSRDGITGSRRWNLTNEKAIHGNSHAK